MSTLIQGYDGSVTLPSGWSMKVDSFSVNIAQDVEDVTGWEDSGWRDFIYGCKTWTATVTGRAYCTSGEQPLNVSAALSGELLLQACTGSTISGSVILTSQDFTRQVCQSSPVTLQFQGKGAPTITWAGS